MTSSATSGNPYSQNGGRPGAGGMDFDFGGMGSGAGGMDDFLSSLFGGSGSVGGGFGGFSAGRGKPADAAGCGVSAGNPAGRRLQRRDPQHHGQPA